MRIVYVSRHFNHGGYAILKRLIEAKVDIAAVVLHENSDPWRKQLYRFFLIKLYRLKCMWYRCKPLKTINSEELLARRNKIPVLLINSIKSNSTFYKIKEKSPDLIILGGGWHELIPERIYSMPPLGCINAHPSLLPEFRGTSITRWQVLNGIKKSGSVILYVDGEFDTGGILRAKTCSVTQHTAPQELFKQLSYIGADIMIDLLKCFEETGKQPTFHREGEKKYCQYYPRWKWDNERLKINWSLTLKKVHFHILANTQESYEYAGPWFFFNGRKIIIRITKLHELKKFNKPKDKKINTNHLYVIKKTEKTIFMHRKEDPNVLELVQAQLDDKFRNYRRGHAATRLIKLEELNIFTQIE